VRHDLTVAAKTHDRRGGGVLGAGCRRSRRKPRLWLRQRLERRSVGLRGWLDRQRERDERCRHGLQVVAALQFQEHGHAPVVLVLRADVRERPGVRVAGHLADLRGRDLVLQQLAACGVGAVSGKLPTGVLLVLRGEALLGVAFQLDPEGVGVARKFPGQCGENPAVSESVTSGEGNNTLRGGGRGNGVGSP